MASGQHFSVTSYRTLDSCNKHLACPTAAYSTYDRDTAHPRLACPSIDQPRFPHLAIGRRRQTTTFTQHKTTSSWPSDSFTHHTLRVRTRSASPQSSTARASTGLLSASPPLEVGLRMYPSVVDELKKKCRMRVLAFHRKLGVTLIGCNTPKRQHAAPPCALSLPEKK